jgi:hypothetical protein
MRQTSINTMLFFVIVIIIGITLSSSATSDNDDYAAAANIDGIDFDTFSPVHQLDARAAKSRFWKRARHHKFWKRSISDQNQ